MCLQAEGHGVSTQPRASQQQAAASSVTSPCRSATASRHPSCLALLSLWCPGWGHMKAAPHTGSSMRKALLKISVLFFFFNNEAKIKILYFHYSLFSQPTEQKHKALLLLPLAPWPCLFLPWSSIKERRKLKLLYARRLQHAYLIFMMDLNC